MESALASLNDIWTEFGHFDMAQRHFLDSLTVVMNGPLIVPFCRAKDNAKMLQTDVALERTDNVQVPTVSPDQSGLCGAVSRPVHGDITLLCRPRRACGVGRGDTLSFAGRVAGVRDPRA